MKRPDNFCWLYNINSYLKISLITSNIEIWTTNKMNQYWKTRKRVNSRSLPRFLKGQKKRHEQLFFRNSCKCISPTLIMQYERWNISNVRSLFQSTTFDEEFNTEPAVLPIEDTEHYNSRDEIDTLSITIRQTHRIESIISFELSLNFKLN